MSEPSPTPIDSGGYRYWAFISYSHQDNLATRGDGSGDHIRWANWLHEQLETYRIPDDYRDRATRIGEPMPERFFPTFRDEAELPTSHDLGGQIRDALDGSRFLIVIASPRSARSRYVNEEVRYFRQLGRGNRILVMIVEGEPNVRLYPKADWTAADDCFGPALVHPLGPDGRVDETVLLPEEPIAADVRVKDTEPPREIRASEQNQPDRHGLLDFMKLKLIAGLMGVGLDELVQRDKRRTEEELRRVRREASRTEFLFARQLFDLKDYPKAYVRLSKAIESDPENRSACVLGLEEIRRRGKRGLLREHVNMGGFIAVFSPDGGQILTASQDGTARLWDTATGQLLIEPLRHQSAICSAEFSPDGKRILTASKDGTARLWVSVTGQEFTKPLTHQGAIYTAVFSPDGARILTASEDGIAQIWDAASGHPHTAPLQHNNAVFSAMFSPNDNGARILSGPQDGSVHLRNAATGEALFEPLQLGTGFPGPSSAKFSRNGKQFLTLSSGGGAQLWDAASGRPLGELIRHESRVWSAVLSADGTRILTASFDSTAQLWDATTSRLLAESLRHKDRVYGAEFSPDGTKILTASKDGTARLWDAATGQPLFDPLRHKGEVYSAVFSPDGAWILTAAARDGTARLWDAATGQPITEPLRHKGEVYSAVFSPGDNGMRILSAPYGRAARLWNTATGQLLAEFSKSQASIHSTAFSSDGTRILTTFADQSANLWVITTTDALREPLQHDGEITCAVFRPDGAQILTSSIDGRTRIWNILDRDQPREHLLINECIYFARFSPDSTWILTLKDDKTARIWNVATRQPNAEQLLHDDTILSAEFSPDSTRILTVSKDKTARLWDAATGKSLAEPLCHEGEVRFAVFSPDGAKILTVSNYKTVRIWDAATAQPLSEPLLHKPWVNSAAFSPNDKGMRILTSSLDGTVRLWDADTGQLLAEPLQHEGRVKSAVFSPDGTSILSIPSDGTTRLWDAAIGELNAEDTLRLRHLLEIAGGQRLNAHGLLEPVPPADIEKLRHDFDTATEMDRLLRWWWSDPFTRNINPSSAITVPDFVRRRIREVLDWPDDKVKAGALREARDAFPHHPLVLLCLAEQGKHGDPAWLAQYAVSRLLAEPHFHVPLPPPRNDTERAARAHELTAGLAEDCFLAARLLLRQARPELAQQCLARALRLCPENEEYRKLQQGMNS